MQARECTSALLTFAVPSVSMLCVVTHCGIVLGSCVNVKRVLPGHWERVYQQVMEHSLDTENATLFESIIFQTFKKSQNYCCESNDYQPIN